MRHSTLYRCCLLAFALGACASCSSDKEDAEGMTMPERAGHDGRPQILTTFYPLQFFAEHLAGAWAEVTCPLPDDADPIFWMPDDAAIQAYQAADLVFINGAQFEKWVDKVSLPAGNVIDTSSNFSGRFLSYEDAVVHQHGPEGEHTHEGIDGHTWVAPELALLQIDAMTEALVERWPARRDEIHRARSNLADELASLSRGFSDVAAALGSQALLASHPAYQYWARQYGVTMVSLDLDPDAAPSPEDRETLSAEASSSEANILLWESDPVDSWLPVAEAAGLRNLLFSPCETPPPANENYFSVMQGNLERLQNAVEDSAEALEPEPLPTDF